jgi:TolB protein
MNADGSEQMELNDDTRAYRDLTWSPDGERLACEIRGDIYVMNADGSDLTNLTNTPDARDIEPAWAPDSTRLAFASNRENNNFDMYIMNDNGSDVTRITDNEAWLDSSPTWSPDGTQIAFRSSRDRDDEIYVMNMDGTNQTNLTSNSDADDINPVWSP